MGKPVILIFLPFILLLLVGCVPHRAFVATPYEPVLVKKKGDLELNGGIRPFKYLSLTGTVAMSDFMALRAGYGGFIELDNFNASLIFFKNFARLGLFAAPSFNYQHNTISRNTAGIFLSKKVYRYNCEYYSPGLVIGFKFNGEPEDPSHQFIVKMQYNVVTKYNYEFDKNNNSGLSGSYRIYDYEMLFRRIPSFVSVEPSYVLLIPLSSYFTVKGQASALICDKTYRHRYQFNDGTYGGGTIVNANKLHPFTFPVNLSVGAILTIEPKQKKHFDSRAFE